jgi:hypothetical protein
MIPFPVFMLSAGNWYVEESGLLLYILSIDLRGFIRAKNPNSNVILAWSFCDAPPLYDYWWTPCEKFPLYPEGLKESLGVYECK